METHEKLSKAEELELPPVLHQFDKLVGAILDLQKQLQFFIIRYRPPFGILACDAPIDF